MALSNDDHLAALSRDLIQALDNLSGLHPGFRPAHAKGIMLSGVFHPAAGAGSLTRAPHVQRQSTPVTVRFSDSGGVPTVADNDPNVAGPRGIAIRFHLAEHVHTDIIGHSTDGFPVRTAEEFLEFLRARHASGPGAPRPTPVESFLATHPAALKFVQTPKPIPTSFAKESFFTVTAFKFTNKAGNSRYGRFRIRPEGAPNTSMRRPLLRNPPISSSMRSSNGSRSILLRFTSWFSWLWTVTRWMIPPSSGRRTARGSSSAPLS